MTTTLLEAHRRFAAALDDLRRQYVTDFERWLRGVGSSQEADEKIATARAKFSDDFLDQHAPPIIRALNRIGYQGPLSVEWEDSGMDRAHGATEAAAFVKRMDFAPSAQAFDAAFEKK